MAETDSILHHLRKDGLLNLDRDYLLRAATQFRLEERSLADFINIVTKMAEHLLYFDSNNKPAGSWKSFFEQDPAVILAHILSYDQQKLTSDFEIAADLFLYKQFTGTAEPEDWSGITSPLTDLFRQTEVWHRAFHSSDGETHHFREHLHQLITIFQQTLHQLQVLCEMAEKTTGQKLLLETDQLQHLSLEKISAHTPEEQITLDEISQRLHRIFNRISNNLNHVKKKAGAYFEKSLHSGSHEPHIGLLIAFLELYRKSAGIFDDISERHRDYYYRDVLRLKESPPAPDYATVTFGMSDDYNDVHIPNGTLFAAGKDPDGREIIYELTEDVILSRARIAEIRTLFLGMNKMYGPELENDHPFITGIYKADITGYNFSGKIQPILGEDQTGLMEHNRTMDDALTGFALAGVPFFLSEGNRHIKLKLQFETDGYRKFLQKAKHVAKEHDNETQRSLLVKLFTDGFLMDYTSTLGWTRKARFAVLLPHELSDASNPYIEISFVLEKDEESCTAYNPEVHGGAYKTPHPIVRFTLNPNAHLFAYSMLSDLNLVSVQTDIKVHGLHDLVIYNNASLVNTDEPFLPFGPVPLRGSSMIIGHKEAFYKSLSSIRLHLHWDRLPDLPRGMADHYQDYRTEIDNTSFRIQISSLSGGKWSALEKENRYLFQTRKTTGTETPEPQAQLSDTTLFSNISLRDSGMHNQPDKIGRQPVYTTRSENGFLKAELTSPEMAFGHKEYPQLLSSTFLRNARIKNSKKMLPVPKEPYTPQLQSVILDYAHNVSKDIWLDAKTGGFDFYHILPQASEKRVNTSYEEKNIALLPRFEYQGYLTLKIENVHPPQAVSLFFQLKENVSNNVFLEPPKILWEYFFENRWHPLRPDAVIHDTTNGFMNTGIVVLELPAILETDAEIKKTAALMIRACAGENADTLSLLKGIITQAAVVTRKPEDENDPLHPISAGSITSMKKNVPGIVSVNQPLPSFGGRAAEKTREFYIGTQELLRHRNRAITPRDYEQIALCRFDDIRKANCLPGVSTGNPESDPGCLVLAVIPDVLKYPDTAKARPRFSAGKLIKIRDFMIERMSPFARIEVCNPLYERITVRCKVAFQKGGGAYYLKKLNQELTVYISPWLIDHKADITFGETINLADIKGFIHSRPYVKFVTGLSILKITEQNKNRYGLTDSARYSDADTMVIPTRPWSVMVSDTNHEINVLDEREYLEPNDAGIDNLELGDSFIIT